MKPTEQLIEEHNAIKEMLNILDKVSQKLDSGEKVEPRHLELITDFIRVFTDKCHHGKEEGILFPAMVEAGISKEGGPIGVMLSEHDQGRKYIRQIISGIESYKEGKKSAAAKISENARKYIKLLEGHIYKEDNVLYPLADSHLSQDKQNQLLIDFDKLEQEVIGAGKHEELHKTLHYLQKEYSDDVK